MPAAILEDGDALLAWATQAIAIARAQRAAPRNETHAGLKPSRYDPAPILLAQGFSPAFRSRTASAPR